MRLEKYRSEEKYRVFDDDGTPVAGVVYTCSDSEGAPDHRRHGFFERVEMWHDGRWSIDIDLSDGEPRTERDEQSLREIGQMDGRTLAALKYLPEHVRRAIKV